MNQAQIELDAQLRELDNTPSWEENLLLNDFEDWVAGLTEAEWDELMTPHYVSGLAVMDCLKAFWGGC